MYSSGQLAKQCHVTLRTVQYYERQGLLVASRTEADRRLYAKDQVTRLEMILTYKELGFTLKDIKGLLDTPENYKILQLLVAQHQEQNAKELERAKKRAVKLDYLAKQLEKFQVFPGNFTKGIEFEMEKTKKLHRLHWQMIGIGLVIDVILWGSIIYVFLNHGSWWSVAGALVISVVIATALVYYVWQHTAYICPNCQHKFRPGLKAYFWSAHTPSTRKLVCPNCSQKNFCIEVYADKQA
ncbi:MerR family transcriptional regulator [Ligilactobacillus murinus]|uniref:MerR family transcriptional regulator n=1 Tax=Ligilactobacillus murinus TaxID=1622 RepID=UPI0010725351|nr:MerR family transcriptional regulator [Ligilactobacillus murinus]MBF0757676.1 MerR family transcriptional regulator [Ligilactobacillus murinus]MBF0833426.1 MerR family transcriptional regulator [Ligilactobacillus murinus]TFU65690.1 MerR family transcriptional regulator [Ligilactobacillus murinus]